jgi:hypothetical protein
LTGLFFGDMEFIRTHEAAGSRYQTVFSADRAISFELPRNWTIHWLGALFTATNPAGSVHLKGMIRKASKGVSQEDPLAVLLPSCLIQDSGLQHSERFGVYTWKEHSYSYTSDGARGQALLLTTELQGSALSMVFLTPEGGLTEQVQQVVNHLLGSFSHR